jgi:hypothetical protein
LIAPSTALPPANDRRHHGKQRAPGREAIALGCARHAGVAPCRRSRTRHQGRCFGLAGSVRLASGPHLGARPGHAIRFGRRILPHVATIHTGQPLESRPGRSTISNGLRSASIAPYGTHAAALKPDWLHRHHSPLALLAFTWPNGKNNLATVTVGSTQCFAGSCRAVSRATRSTVHKQEGSRERRRR